MTKLVLSLFEGTPCGKKLLAFLHYNNGTSDIGQSTHFSSWNIPNRVYTYRCMGPVGIVIVEALWLFFVLCFGIRNSCKIRYKNKYGHNHFKVFTFKITINPNTFVGLVGKVRKKYLPKEEGREGGEKSAHSAPAGPGARTRDLPHARRGSGAARQGGCLDKQAFPCL